MNEFSDIGMEVNSNNSLKMAKKQSSHLEYTISKVSHLDSEHTEEEQKEDTNKKKLRRTSTISYIINMINSNSDSFKNMSERKINIFEMEKKLGRDHLMPMMTIHSLLGLGLQTIINETKMAIFLDKVFSAYDRKVQYHNDLHGADVMQMMYHMITRCKL